MTKISNSNPLLEAISAIKSQNKGVLASKDTEAEEIDIKTGDIVDIMTFCNNPNYLNLKGNNFNLFLAQRTILKTFYMGTIGNENLKLDKDEWDWLYLNSKDEDIDGIIYEKNCDKVIEKLKKIESGSDNINTQFKKLHLVLGRRASKTILASVITAYEVYKLITINKGDPHSYYSLPFGAEIVIINVALSQKQAGHLFSAISDRIESAPIFKGRIAKGTTQEIGIYTNRELEKKLKGDSVLANKPSIRIICGHSNPKTLRGHNAILLLFDELAFYDDTGKITGSQFYNDLEPSISHFVPYGHDRIVCISSPSSMSGIFYDIFKQSDKTREVLAYQLPTWSVNPTVTYESLTSKRERNPETFAIEYGAQWSRSGSSGVFFPETLVDRCLQEGILKGVAQMTRPDPKFHYYLHVDPANGGDRYVAVMVAREVYKNQNNEKRVRARLANIWVWEPTPGAGLVFSEIDKNVLSICRLFRPRVVTYDQWNSLHSLQFLKSCGVPCKETSFNRSYKEQIYMNLREMMSYQPTPELWLYDDYRLTLEMKSLRYRPTKRGFTLIKDKRGESTTDDIVDCLAGAVSSSASLMLTPLPRGITTNLGRAFR